MKNITTLILIAIALISCKKDNTSNTTPAISIVGKWHYTKDRSQVLSSTGAVILDETSTTFTSYDYIQFNADGTGVAAATNANGNGSDVVDYNYTVTGNTITEYQTPLQTGQPPYIFTYTLTSTTLTLHEEYTQDNQKYISDSILTK